MVAKYNPKDPTAVVVSKLAGHHSGTGTFFGVKSVRIPVSTGSANALTNWVNPEGGTLVATVYVVVRKAGSGGTCDVGVSQNGTGSNDNMINGGTVGVAQVLSPGTVSATAVTGNTQAWFVIQPGTGTNNSIVMNHNDAAGTGTLVADLIVQYIPIA